MCVGGIIEEYLKRGLYKKFMHNVSAQEELQQHYY